MGETIGGERTTVLVVDDERDSADLHAEYLTDDYTVRTAYSGEEALEMLDADVAVVLLDRRMPGLSGDDVLTKIRDGEFDPRVVLVTAIALEVETLNLSFDDYLVKPVSGDELRDAVARMVLRNACDERLQDLVGLSTRMATLEAKMSIQELEASSVYTALQEQLAELRVSPDPTAAADDCYVEFTSEKLASLLS